jgi:hypothetical protein
MNHATFREHLNIKFQSIFYLFGDEDIPHEKLIPFPYYNTPKYHNNFVQPCLQIEAASSFKRLVPINKTAQ